MPELLQPVAARAARLRPTAHSSASNAIAHLAPVGLRRRGRCVRRRARSAAPCGRSAPSTPSRSSACARAGRRPPRPRAPCRRGAISTCVTCEPSRAKACASSQPIGPPPSTTRRRGSSRRPHSVSLVRQPTSLEPRQRRHERLGAGGDDDGARRQRLLRCRRPRRSRPATGRRCARGRARTSTPSAGVALDRIVRLDLADDAPRRAPSPRRSRSSPSACAMP